MKWYWADLHFDHEKLITKMGRKAESIEQWNETAVRAIRDCVKPGDHFYILGDFAWKDPQKWREKINVRHAHLILGNHDLNAVKKCFTHIWTIKDVKIHGVHTVLCHYPMAFWDRSHYGAYHLYGHIHNSPPREERLDLMGDRRSLDVSPESSMVHLGEYRPFNDDDIHRILGARAGHDKPMLEML